MKFRDTFVELALLCSMSLTLLIPSARSSIISWTEISLLLFIRASVWLVGLSLLPGYYILRLTEMGQKLSRLEKIVVGINLSFVLLGLASVLLYYLQGIHLLPWFFLAFLGSLTFLNWKKYKVNPSIKKIKIRISKWNLLLFSGVIITIYLAFYFQLVQRYLLPGDIWVSLNPAVQIISQRNVYEVFGNYPLMFGHILTSLSICSGLPIVNIYAILFPFVALNLLSFFIFIKTVLKLNDKIASFASLIYGFGAGFGLLIQFLGFDGTLGFMELYRLATDYSLPNFNAMLFSYKSVAVTQSFTSIVCLMVATKLEKTRSKIVALVISGLLLLFSFYIHVIEALIVIPLIFLVPYFYEKKWNRYFFFGFFIIIIFCIVFILDFFMDGFYLALTFDKLLDILFSGTTENILTYSLLLIGGSFFIFISAKLVKKGLRMLDKLRIERVKPLFIAILLVVYVCGIWFWKTPSPQSYYPWYRYITRYGFTGIFTLIGVVQSKWKEKWFVLLAFWFLYILFVGQVGGIRDTYLNRRISSVYSVPIVTIFASIGLLEIWKKANTSIRVSTSTSLLQLNLKPIIIVLIIGLSIYSVTSTIYGTVYYYGWNDPCISDDTARAFAWINENTSNNVTILVPKVYNIYHGVRYISDREIYLYDDLPTTMNSIIDTLRDHNIKYVFTFEDDISVLQYLSTQLYLVFESGNVKMFKFPDFY